MRKNDYGYEIMRTGIAKVAEQRDKCMAMINPNAARGTRPARVEDSC